MKWFKRFQEIVIGLSDNAAFVAILMTVPNIKAAWLIWAHLIVIAMKAVYYKDRKLANAPAIVENPLAHQDTYILNLNAFTREIK